MAVTQQQKVVNKTVRLKNAAAPNDGLTVQLSDGTTPVFSYSKALRLEQQAAAAVAE